MPDSAQSPGATADETDELCCCGALAGWRTEHSYQMRDGDRDTNYYYIRAMTLGIDTASVPSETASGQPEVS